jgi:GntR family transcriptional repressor for pyruvate dehydrogenase complex
MVRRLVGGSGELVPVRKQQLVDLVVQQLDERLRNGEFAVGRKLPSELELASMFGVGRTTIREAIRVFSHAGVLDVRQGDGTYVRAPGRDVSLAERLRDARVIDVYEVRQALEVEAAGLAAQRRDEQDLEVIRNLVARLRGAVQTRNRAQFLATDLSLHLAVVSSTKNPVLIDFYHSFVPSLEVALTQVVGIPGAMERCVARHERLLEALIDRDRETARSRTQAYLESVSSLLREIVGEAVPVANPG